MRVRLRQDRHPAPEAHVVGAVPAQRRVGVPAGRLHLVVHVAVDEDRLVVAGLERVLERGQHLVAHEVRGPRRPDGLQGRRVGQQVTVARAVSGVEVHHQRGIPRVIDPRQRRACLRRLGLEVVAVEVEVEPVGPLAHDEGAHLLRAVHRHRAEGVVAVGVVVRRGEDDQLLQQVAAGRGQLPEQDEDRFLPLHFARVDVALQVHHQLPRGGGFRRRRHGRIGGDDEVERPALDRTAHLRDGERGAGELEAVEKGAHLGAGGGGVEVAPLGGRGRPRLGGRGGRQADEGDDEQGDDAVHRHPGGRLGTAIYPCQVARAKRECSVRLPDAKLPVVTSCESSMTGGTWIVILYP